MGDTGLTLSEIGFGAFKIGRNQGAKYPHDYDLPDDRTVDALLNGVLDLGVTYIDTAPAYGLSEERIGRAVGHRRDEFVLSTKVGETFENGQSTYDFSTNAVRAGIERSLRRLRRDALDIVFVHADRDDVAVLRDTEVVTALQALRDAGLVRWIGFSGYTAEATRQSLEWSNVIMVEYHANDRSMEPTIAEAAARGVSVVVKKGLASGHLEAAAAIRFVLSNPAVTSMVVGGLSLDHMCENVLAARAARPSADRAGKRTQ